MAAPNSGLPPKKPASSSGEPRVNRQINAESIRLIAANGDMLGLSTFRDAMRLAEEAGLDLVEISPGAKPPVCKIMDYGKYRYQLQKKAQEARKKQKIIEIKEIKLRPGIDPHDLEIKMRSVFKFLGEGDKVKFTLRFRGREMAHQNIGLKLLTGIKEQLEGKAKIDSEPKSEGRVMIMVVSPIKP